MQTVGYSPSSIQDKELVLDNSGNICLTGYFNTSATFGATNFTSTGQKDIYIAKFNNAGSLQWVQKAGGPADDEATDLAIAINGYLISQSPVCGAINPRGEVPVVLFQETGHAR